MEELNSAPIKAITNGHKGTNQASAGLSLLKGAMEKWVRRVTVFVIYGPGVLGFLWLIGRFLKR